MGWVGILLWVITHASDLISLVQIVIALIGSFPKDKARQVKFDIQDAIKHHDAHRLKDVLEAAKNYGTVGVTPEVKKD